MDGEQNVECQYCGGKYPYQILNEHEDECQKTNTIPSQPLIASNQPTNGPPEINARTQPTNDPPEINARTQPTNDPPQTDTQPTTTLAPRLDNSDSVDSLPTSDGITPAVAAELKDLREKLKIQKKIYEKFRSTVALVLFVMFAVIIAGLAVLMYPKQDEKTVTKFDSTIDRQIQLKVIAKFHSLIDNQVQTIFSEKFEQNIDKEIRTRHAEQLEQVNIHIIKPLEDKINEPAETVQLLTKLFYIYVVLSLCVASILVAIPFYLKSKREI